MAKAVDINTEIFNLTLALQSVGGDWEFLTEIAGLVQAAWPTLLEDLKDGMAKGDLRAVERRVRLAKAAARNVSASRAYECALELETMMAKGDLFAAQEAIVKLEQEGRLLQSALATLRDSGGHGVTGGLNLMLAKSLRADGPAGIRVVKGRELRWLLPRTHTLGVRRS